MEIALASTPPKVPARPKSTLPPCPVTDTIHVDVIPGGIRTAGATRTAVQWRGWAVPSGRSSADAILAAYVPHLMAIPATQVLISESGAFHGLRPVRPPFAEVDTSGQTLVPGITASLFAVPMLGRADSVEVRADTREVTVTHFTSGFPKQRSVVHSVLRAPRSTGPTEWHPVGRRATYPTLRWAWTPTGDTVVVAASLSRVGTDRVMRTLLARQP